MTERIDTPLDRDGEGLEPSGGSRLRGASRLKIVEGIAGVWHYHLSESGETWQPALCGNNQVMLTMIPLSHWMDKRPSHIPSSYCKACDKLYSARSAPEAVRPEGPSNPQVNK